MNYKELPLPTDIRKYMNDLESNIHRYEERLDQLHAEQRFAFEDAKT